MAVSPDNARVQRSVVPHDLSIIGSQCDICLIDPSVRSLDQRVGAQQQVFTFAELRGSWAHTPVVARVWRMRETVPAFRHGAEPILGRG